MNGEAKNGTEKPAQYYIREERRKEQRAADRAKSERNAGTERQQQLETAAAYHGRIASLLEAAYGKDGR